MSSLCRNSTVMAQSPFQQQQQQKAKLCLQALYAMLLKIYIKKNIV